MESRKSSIVARSAVTGAVLLSSVFYPAVGSSPAQARSFYDSMLFHPRTVFRNNPDIVGGIQKHTVSFKTAHGARVRGWYFDVPESDKIVLVSEGNGGNMDYLVPLAELLIQCKASVLLYDYEGYGETVGNPSLGRVVEDGLAAYDYLVKNLAGDKKIVLLGVSLGTGISCQLLKERPADAIILSSPFTSLLNMARMKIGYFKYVPTFALPRQHLDNVAVLKNPHPPLLILHGTDDGLIPVSEAEKLYEAAAAPKTLVKLETADHNDTFKKTKAEYLKALQDFFEKLPAKTPTK